MKATIRKDAAVRALVVLLSLTPATLPGSGADLALWYRQPASNRRHLEEALPLGNGRMGCLLSGGIARERVQFNEQSLWSGDNNWDGDYECGDHGFGAYRNFGITGAIAEMLLQSHAGEIAILPAIPKAWTASGSFRGLKARGNFTVDATWKDGKVTDFSIRSPTPRAIKVRVNEEIRVVTAARE